MILLMYIDLVSILVLMLLYVMLLDLGQHIVVVVVVVVVVALLLLVLLLRASTGVATNLCSTRQEIITTSQRYNNKEKY